MQAVSRMARQYGVNPRGYGFLESVTPADRLLVDPSVDGYGSVYQHAEGVLSRVASDTAACSQQPL